MLVDLGADSGLAFSDVYNLIGAIVPKVCTDTTAPVHEHVQPDQPGKLLGLTALGEARDEWPGIVRWLYRD